VRLENLADYDFDTNYAYYNDHENDDDTDIIDDDDEDWEDDDDETYDWEDEENDDDEEDEDYTHEHPKNKTTRLAAVRQSMDKKEYYVDLDKLVAALVEKHLNGLVGVKIQIEETSLSGAETYLMMEYEKTRW
jgi:hypothetical protein